MYFMGNNSHAGVVPEAQWGKPYGVDGISVFMRTDEPFVFKLSGYGL